MSYLRKFEAKELPNNLGIRYAIKWRSVSGVIRLSQGVIYYSRYSKLGELLSRNAECERHFICQAIRVERGVPDTQRFEFQSV